MIRISEPESKKVGSETRKIIGWTFSRSTGAELVTESLLMAFNEEKPDPGLIFHSDQETEYASNLYHRTLKERGIRISVSRKGYSWDNAYMESFFHSHKTEMIYFNHFETLEQATAYINTYIYFITINEFIHDWIIKPLLNSIQWRHDGCQ